MRQASSSPTRKLNTQRSPPSQLQENLLQYHISPLLQIMEDNSFQKWSSDMEMDHDVNECLCHTNTFDEEFLRDILLQPQDQSTAPIATSPLNSLLGQTTSQIMNNKNNSNSQHNIIAEKTTSLSAPTTYILSFDKSTTLLPSDNHQHDPCWKEGSQTQTQLGKHPRDSSLPFSSSRSNQGSTKKSRSASETLDHIMSERNRRQELTRKFIALSATIPGLKKMDKAHVLREAINYVKQLEERVKELEEDIKKNGVESVITITRSHLCVDNDTALGEKMNTEESSYGPNETLPEVEARVLGKEVLIKIHCGKQNGILLRIMSQLESLHLSVTTSNVLPFGNTLDITIIAQMGEKYNMIVKDLVKELRLVTMLQECDVQQ